MCSEFKWVLLIPHICQHWVSFVIFMLVPIASPGPADSLYHLHSWLNEINGIIWRFNHLPLFSFSYILTEHFDVKHQIPSSLRLLPHNVPAPSKTEKKTCEIPRCILEPGKIHYKILLGVILLTCCLLDGIVFKSPSPQSLKASLLHFVFFFRDKFSLLLTVNFSRDLITMR